MKYSLIAALLLTGCAVGSTGEPEESEPAEVVHKVPQRPAPVPQEEPEPDHHCKVFSEWINDCLVTSIVCEGKLTRVEVKCGRGRPLFPWEYIPDPPPYESNDVRRRNSH